MVDFIDTVLAQTSSFLWGSILLFLLMGTHLYLTIRLRFPQRHLFRGMSYYFKKEDSKNGEISQFSSLMVALAANIGTGNIIGVATAVAIGGPGAIFWCWLTGFLGMATRYSEGLLSIKYRQVKPDGTIRGGPMYIISMGMKNKWLAVIFAVFTTIAAFGIGNITQGNAAANVLNESFGIDPWVTAACLAVLVGAVLLGGLKGISSTCKAVVPTMAVVYMVGCIYILCVQYEYIFPAISHIFESAFSSGAATGGFVGSTIMLAMSTGVARGLFSNEAGMGSSPIVSAAARSKNPVQQGLVSSTGPFWDTVVICTLTGLVLVTSVMAHPDINYTDGAMLTHICFNKIAVIGGPLLTISLLSFVISTLLGWSYFGEKALEYLGGEKLIKPYRVLWVIAVFVGCITKIEIVWNFADCANALMALPNLICLLALSGVIVQQTRHYLWENRLDEE